MKGNKRFYDRTRLNEYFIVLDGSGDRILGRMINMSSDGMMLLAEDPIQTPIVAKCKMELPHMVQGYQHWEFDIETRWCERTKHTGLFEIGCKFINLTEDSKKLIKSILATWMSEEGEHGQSGDIRIISSR